MSGAKFSPGEGFSPRAAEVVMKIPSADRDPSPGFAARSHPLPQGERVPEAPHGSTVIGEKSISQLLGWITPLIFALIARGPTSWAT
jgi:hypothetical protein